MKFDKKDRQIITLLSINPSNSQENIAKEVDLSQPSVASRIKHLKEKGIIRSEMGIDPLKIGLNVCMITLKTTDPIQILDMFKFCPFFINGFTTSGRNNLCLFFMGDKISSMESIISNHLRTKDFVQDLEFNIIISTEKPLVVPTQLIQMDGIEDYCVESHECRDCPKFKSDKCSGCPIADNYEGWLL